MKIERPEIGERDGRGFLTAACLQVLVDRVELFFFLFLVWHFSLEGCGTWDYLSLKSLMTTFLFGLLCAGIGCALGLWGARIIPPKPFRTTGAWIGLSLFTIGLIYAWIGLSHLAVKLHAVAACPPCY